jgi:hypothetical protein
MGICLAILRKICPFVSKTVKLTNGENRRIPESRFFPVKLLVTQLVKK